MSESYADGALVLAPGPVATLTMDRPARRNAMTQAMWRALPEICARIAGDDAIRVLVLRGAGRAAFSAGADISEFEEVYRDAEAARAYNAAVREGQARLAALPQPAVAQIHGACFGGGCGLALSCDFRVAEPGARFAITPARLGIAYSPADTLRLIEAVGRPRAKDLLLTGRAVDAEEARAIGLVDRLEEDAEAGAARLAEDLSRLPPTSLRAIKRIADGTGRGEDEAPLRALFEATFESEAFAEGRRAFLERRPPRFGPEE